MKHNNAIPNVHYHKWWQRHVKTWFNQPAKKQARRLARQTKATEMAPMPVDKLHPHVRCQTQRYNFRLREGRGFSLQELKAAGVSAKHAKTVGIAVDHRRTNKCQESLDTNVALLKKYIASIMILPRGNKARKAMPGSGLPDDASRESIAKVPTVNIATAFGISRKIVSEPRAIQPEDLKRSAFCTLRQKLRDAHFIGRKKKSAA